MASWTAAETLASRRWAELERSASILGVARLVWLGYADSGSAPSRESGSAPSRMSRARPPSR